MNSRLYDLLQRFGLENRLIENLEYGEKVISKPVDYSNTNKILETERIKSLDYLRRGLSHG